MDHTTCKQCLAYKDQIKSLGEHHRASLEEYQNRHSKMKRAKDRAELKAGKLERDNQRLKIENEAAKAQRQEERQQQLDVEDSCTQVERWKSRSKEAGRENAALKKENKRLQSAEDARAKELKDVRKENTQLHAALLGARQRIRNAEIARDEALAKQFQMPPQAPDGWVHSITMGEHLKDVAKMQKQINALKSQLQAGGLTP